MEIIQNKMSLPAFNTYQFTVTQTQSGQRLDKFLTSMLPSYSRSFFQDLIEQGHIIINATQKAKASTLLKTDDHVTITIAPPAKRPIFNRVQDNLGIEILHTHEHFFIINKPAGLLVHQTEVFTQASTVVDWLLSNYAQNLEVGSIERPGIVHRLDKDTSGLLIIARSNTAHVTFSSLFKKHAIAKTYVAIVHGHPPASGIIDFSISRDPVNRKKMTTHLPDIMSLTQEYRTHATGTKRAARTQYKVLQYFDKHALVELKPTTGRTHQIRVHCAAIGHPLIGDSLYGISSKLIARHALHASQLSFKFSDQEFNFTAEFPDDFKKLVDLLQNS